MSRRRYISTEISLDTKVNRLGLEYGDFAVLVYTWLIPHAEDTGIAYGNPEELLMRVAPGRRDKTPADMEAALSGMAAVGLVVWEPGADQVEIPPSAFYKYQTYIKPDRRRAVNDAQNADPIRGTPQNTANQRTAPQNTASFNTRLTSTSTNATESPSCASAQVVASSRVDAKAALEATDDPVDALYHQLEPFIEHNLNAEAQRKLWQTCKDVHAGKVAGVTDANAPEIGREWYTVRRPNIDTPTGRATSLGYYLDGWAKKRDGPQNGHKPEPTLRSVTPEEIAAAEVRFGHSDN